MLRSLTLFAVMCFMSLLLTTTANAEQKQSIGKYDIHYMAIDSTFLTPEIAKHYGLTRSQYNGIINISVLDTSKEGNPSAAVEIHGVAKNLLQASQTLTFKEIREGGAIYYIAELPFRDEQQTNFSISIRRGNELNTRLEFSHKFYIN
ncbi:DUF4426 domain-containing protein [Shewanella maritima]|uniref:DUF4426 domain-containing protein n=1 Tax=Shewanella maritima TaxID=2520507 RepID=UPI0037370963